MFPPPGFSSLRRARRKSFSPIISLTVFALNPYQKQLWKVPQTPFISSSQHKVSCTHLEREDTGCSSRLFITTPHMIGLFDQISLLILFLCSFSPPSINASFRLSLSCVEWAKQVSSRMSGRKESSEIMTGTLHDVEIGMIKREKERRGEEDEKCITYCMLQGLISL